VNCGGDSYFGALCNSFIHVLMYAYYLMAALKISCPWKRHLTKMQMIQFLTCIVHAGYLYIHKTVPTVLLALQVVSQEVAIRAKDECFFSSLCCLTRPSPPPPSLFFSQFMMTSMFVLFYVFYMRKYKKKGKKKA